MKQHSTGWKDSKVEKTEQERGRGPARRLTIGLDLGIRRAAIVCWTKRARYCLSVPRRAPSKAEVRCRRAVERIKAPAGCARDLNGSDRIARFGA